ncbi:MAG: phosphoribosylanthranilate isomerase [Gammaproteobacteria bacterium]|jgi:phosphoribosylanthranilate isomerase|nr:phosphoribosylanthranilate isomerase [Gammaproteobacteria bacterium]
MKIKICGLTDPENSKQIASLDIHAIGLVFFNESPRAVSIEQANEIIQELPPFINKVGLFVNANSNFVDQVLNSVNIDTIQFHGDESSSDCSQFQMPFIKAIRMREGINLLSQAEEFSSASGLLLDSFEEDSYGGTGKSFDWNLIKNNLDLPIILAGGLNKDNIMSAIEKTQPYAIDISSGVEVDKGIKDIEKTKEIIEIVKSI